MTEKKQDDTIKSRIIGLLQKGYSRSQLINDFNFAERTVDSAIKDYREQEAVKLTNRGRTMTLTPRH